MCREQLELEPDVGWKKRKRMPQGGWRRVHAGEKGRTYLLFGVSSKMRHCVEVEVVAGKYGY